MFKEVFIDTPVKICEERTPRAITKWPEPAKCRNLQGSLRPEAQSSPELRIMTPDREIADCVHELEEFVSANFNV